SLESTSQVCHVLELRRAGLWVETEVTLPIQYKNRRIDNGYRIDVMVESAVVIENKAVDRLLPIHAAQLITYLKLSDKRLGYLLNWNVRLMRRGIYRFVNGL
ncbi:MAG TPA: GxxExxY protein, partial [Candidatus Sulfomarinibacteraceae bacterium]|nr:GxxExxY protein [Candidatus Sulfomarinibacteraceae bacterium]